MATKNKGYLKVHETVEMTLRGITVWAYTKRGKFSWPRGCKPRWSVSASG
jgi:hypothetical protein